MNISSTTDMQLLIAKLVSADDDLTKAAFALVSAKKKKCKICHGDHDLSYYSTNAEKKLIDANNMMDSMVIKKNKIQKEWFEIAKKNMLLADANELNDFYTQQTCETVKWALEYKVSDYPNTICESDSESIDDCDDVEILYGVYIPVEHFF